MAQLDPSVWTSDAGFMLISMRLQVRLVVALAALFLVSCGSERNQSDPKVSQVTAAELLAFNAQKVAEQAALLDSLAPDSQGFQSDGGMRLKWCNAQRIHSPGPHPDGTIVSWSGEIGLANGETRLSFSSDDPLRLAIGFSDWPESFHEIARKCALGDTIDCWIPAARAWGLTGYPPAIPQDAVIHLQIAVCDVKHAAAA